MLRILLLSASIVAACGHALVSAPAAARARASEPAFTMIDFEPSPEAPAAAPAGTERPR